MKKLRDYIMLSEALDSASLSSNIDLWFGKDEDGLSRFRDLSAKYNVNGKPKDDALISAYIDDTRIDIQSFIDFIIGDVIKDTEDIIDYLYMFKKIVTSYRL